MSETSTEQVCWGAACSGISKRYFHVTYYPEGGSAAYDSTDYIYTSFDRTGKLWVHNGYMQYDIEGIQEGNLGAVTDPHRIIKYLVIHCERYLSYTLCDSRIDTIIVSEGLQTTPAGMYADGSPEGFASSDDNDNDDITTASQNYIRTPWTGPWPLLHIIVLNPINVALELVHLTIDLIGHLSMVSQQIFEYLLPLCGLTPGQVAILLSTIAYVIDGGFMFAIDKAFNAMILSFLVFDATKNLISLALGAAALALTIILTRTLSDIVRNQFKDTSAGILVWAGLLILILVTLVNASASTFAGENQDAASSLFGFASSKFGYSSGTKIGVFSGLVTKFALASLGALCLFAMFLIWTQA